MDTTKKLKPQTIAELLPSLGGILSKDTIQMLTARKQPRQTMAHTSTSEKAFKPMTIAEMKADISVLRVKSPRIAAGRQAATSARKKNWNSSVKVDKKISHTANGQMAHNPVRKVLNFQPKPKVNPIPNPRATIYMGMPKFPVSEFRAKKSLHSQANNVRISGICNIPETPVITNKQIKNRMTTNTNNNGKKITPKPIIIQEKKHGPPVPDTPLSNNSWKSSCDDSFLQKEKEIDDIEEKVKALVEQSLENIAEVSPPVSTPFKDYRSVTEFFNNSSDMENSTTELNDDTIMCFDKPSISKENSKREESVIVSLCDLLNKASVNPSKNSTEIDELLEVEEQTVNNLQLIESIKQGQLRTLQYVRRLIHEKKQQTTTNSEMDKTLVEDTKNTPKVNKKNEVSPEKSPILQQTNSVIKKSPSYKIPKKNLCLRKKVFHKSMPIVSNEILSPSRDMGTRARSMYMKMKEHMNFLNTPVVKKKNLEVPDTPAVTSHNLQKQLDKLYGRS